MKKLVLLLAVIASVSLFSCNKGEGQAAATDSTDTTAVADSADTTAADSAATDSVAPVAADSVAK